MTLAPMIVRVSPNIFRSPCSKVNPVVFSEEVANNHGVVREICHVHLVRHLGDSMLEVSDFVPAVDADC